MDRDTAIELGIALAIAAHLASRREPLSATTRRIFQTHTHTGSRIFATTAGAAIGYYTAHILRQHTPPPATQQGSPPPGSKQ